jgi:antitoxin PrlF
VGPDIGDFDSFIRVSYDFLTFYRTSKMTDIATVTSKGQVTVPIAVRKRLGLKEGDRLAFVNQGGEIIIRLDRGQKNPFAPYAGILGTFPDGLDAINAWVAEQRDESGSE